MLVEEDVGVIGVKPKEKEVAEDKDSKLNYANFLTIGTNFRYDSILDCVVHYNSSYHFLG